MKKRIAALAAALCMALSISGCGNSEQKSSPDTTAAATTTTSAEKPTETTTTAAETTTTTTAATTAETTTAETTAEVKEEPKEEKAEEVKLEYWTEGSEVAQSIVDWVAETTDPSSDKFIPVEDRIVVSDLDGTLIGELYPAYFDYCMFVHRALYDDTYDAPEEMQDYAHVLEEAFKTRTLPKGSDVIHAKWAAEAYKGMTAEELREYTKEFLKSDAEGFNNLTRGEAYYKPMKSLVDYLRANDFTIYVCSGTDRTLVREIAAEMFDIPPYNVIGTDTTMVAENQGDNDGLDYLYKPEDHVVFGGEFIKKNLKMNKVAVIAQEIGIVPVLALGNSSGDLSMCQYTTLNTNYEGRAYLLLCDDTEREYGKPDVAENLKKTCDELGFYTVSMRDDFATIYGDDVTLTKE